MQRRNFRDTFWFRQFPGKIGPQTHFVRVILPEYCRFYLLGEIVQATRTTILVRASFGSGRVMGPLVSTGAGAHLVRRGIDGTPQEVS